MINSIAAVEVWIMRMVRDGGYWHMLVADTCKGVVCTILLVLYRLRCTHAHDVAEVGTHVRRSDCANAILCTVDADWDTTHY